MAPMPSAATCIRTPSFPRRSEITGENRPGIGRNSPVISLRLGNEGVRMHVAAEGIGAIHQLLERFVAERLTERDPDHARAEETPLRLDQRRLDPLRRRRAG